MEKTTAPGRPAGFSRNAAIEGAMNLFWRDGYLGVSVSDLATAMNIQRSTFYNSFGSREAVFLEALERYANGAPDSAVDTLAPGEPVLPVVARLFREVCRQRAADSEARGCLVCNSIGELVGVDEELGPVLREALEARVGIFERLLTQAVEQDELALARGVASVARSIVAFLLGINLLSKTLHDEEALWNTCRSFLGGLGVPEPILSTPER